MPRRGQDTRIDMFDEAGNLIDTIQPNSFNHELMMEMDNIDRLGSKEVLADSRGPTGHKGSAEFEVEDHILEELEDTLILKHLRGSKIHRINIVDTISIDGGQTRSYIYPKAVFTISTSSGSAADKVKKTLNWQSGLRYIL